jgi:hypothetical protein
VGVVNEAPWLEPDIFQPAIWRYARTEARKPMPNMPPRLRMPWVRPARGHYRTAEAQVSGTIGASDIMIARYFALALAFAVSLSQFRLLPDQETCGLAQCLLGADFVRTHETRYSVEQGDFIPYLSHGTVELRGR